ncbi:unnamed protein product [Arctogadus glacialis]
MTTASNFLAAGLPLCLDLGGLAGLEIGDKAGLPGFFSVDVGTVLGRPGSGLEGWRAGGWRYSGRPPDVVHKQQTRLWLRHRAVVVSEEKGDESVAGRRGKS